MGSATEWALHSLDRLADREKVNVSNDLKEARERAVWLSQGRALLAEVDSICKSLEEAACLEEQGGVSKRLEEKEQ